MVTRSADVGVTKLSYLSYECEVIGGIGAGCDASDSSAHGGTGSIVTSSSDVTKFRVQTNRPGKVRVGCEEDEEEAGTQAQGPASHAHGRRSQWPHDDYVTLHRHSHQ